MEDFYTKPKKDNKLFDWNDKEFVENYKNRIKSKLESSNYQHMLNELKKCKEKKKSHKLIDELHKELQRIVIECATKAHNELNLTFRSSRMRKRRKSNRWWNDELKDIYEKKKSAYSEYKNSGYDEKLKEKFLEYKRLFKLQKRFNIDLKRNRNLQLMNNMFKMNKTNFWRQVKKLNKNNTQIDAKLEDINNDYDKLFNTRHESKKSMANECKDKINKLIEQFNTLESDNCPVDNIELKLMVKEKIKSLSNNKAIGLSGLSNEMLKNGISNSTNTQEDQANDPLVSSVATLFKSMIINQYVPNFFNFSIIKPLVKDANKDTDNINNLRGIAISDTLQNLYEAVLEDTIKNEITTDKKQMGFKSNNSCSHAIMILKQTMNVARKLGHRLYIAAIDAAKAFDKVNREILWIKMIEIGVSPIIVLAIQSYYSKSMMLVNLEDELSRPFRTTLGVRQGGVLSPLLFSIYINDILIELQKLKVGYKVGSLIIDVLAYADDLLIIAKSKLDLHLLLTKLSDLGEMLEIKFNASKSMYMVLGLLTSAFLSRKWEVFTFWVKYCLH
jgi:hypothetical protein